MKGSHLRRSPYRPHLEFAIGLLGLAVCGIGIGLVTADVMEKTPAEVRLQRPSTTEAPLTVVNSTTTVIPTTTESVPSSVPRKSVTVRPAVSTQSAPKVGYGYGGEQ